MKKFSFLTALLLLCCSSISAQVSISSDGSFPDNSAMLDAKSTTKGVLVPRMTLSSINSIGNPASGLLVFCTDNNQYYSNKGIPSAPNWIMISSQWLQSGNDIEFTTGKIGIGTSSPAWPVDVAGDINYTGTLRKNGVAVATGISAVTATTPLSITGGGIPIIAITQAHASHSGYVSLSDWNTFNNKVTSQWVSGSSRIYYNSGQVGIGNLSPNVSAVLDVASTSQGFSPPRMSAANRNAISAPAAGLVVWCNDCGIFGQMQVYNGTTWVNVAGSAADPVLVIGISFRGGVVAYVFQSGDPGYVEGQTHGLIAAPSDQSSNASWGCDGTVISGADGTALGTGNPNTIDIMTGCATAGIAARLCGDLVLNGYSDWYLPSKDELNLLYINKSAIGGFGSSSYWSSSEYNLHDAWTESFSNGSQTTTHKKDQAYVRAIRTF